MQSQLSDPIELLDLKIAPKEYKVLRAGKDIKLPNLSFQLLIFFIDHAQELCTLEQISEAVWGNTVVSNDTIVQRVTLLRKALDDDAKSPRYIESVRGKGYRLIPLPVASKCSNQDKNNTFFKAASIAFLILVSILILLVVLLPKQQQAPKQIPAPSINNTSDAIHSLIERGDYYYRVGQNKNLELAQNLFKQALEIEPNNLDALTGLSLVLSKSVCRYNQNIANTQDAKSLAEKAISIDVNSSKGYFALAYAWDCIGNLELALLNYKKATKLDTKNFASMGSAAHLYFIKGELLTAYSLSKTASDLNPNSHMPELQIAAILSKLQFTNEAEAAFKNLFALYPDNVFVNQAYPKFLFEHGQFVEAQSAFQIALERNIERASLYADYAEVMWLLEDKNTALTYFEKAAQIGGKNSYYDIVYQLVQNNLGTKEALARINTLNAIVQQGNTWPINYVEAALISLLALNDPQMSIDYLRKAVSVGYLSSEYLRRSPLFANLHQIDASQPDIKVNLFLELLETIDTIREKRQKEFLLQYPNDI